MASPDSAAPPRLPRSVPPQPALSHPLLSLHWLPAETTEPSRCCSWRCSRSSTAADPSQDLSFCLGLDGFVKLVATGSARAGGRLEVTYTRRLPPACLYPRRGLSRFLRRRASFEDVGGERAYIYHMWGGATHSH